MTLESNFCIRIDDKYFYHELLGSGKWGYKKTELKIRKSIGILKMDEYECNLTVSSKSKSGKSLIKIKKYLDVVLSQRKEIETTIRSALYGCATIKQIKENYPGLTTYIKIKEKESKALTVTSSEVKKALLK